MTTETTMDVAYRCREATMRVERIVHLATMACAEPMEYDLFEWLTDDQPHLLDQILAPDTLEGIVGDYDHRRDAAEALQEALSWRSITGWIVAASHPTWEKRGNGLMFSWGMYETKAFYGDTYEAALEQAFAWVEADHDVAMEGRD